MSIWKTVRRFSIRTLPFILLAVVGIKMAPTVISLAQYKDKQAIAYDMAMEAAKKGDIKTVMEALKAEMTAYKNGQDREYWERFNFPETDRELQALAYFHAGNMLLKAGKDKEALAAWVESLRYNPGQQMLPGVSARDDDMHQYGRDFCVDVHDRVGMKKPIVGEACQLRRLQKEADDTRNNIISLVSQKPELMKALANPGELKGALGKGPAQPGDKQGPKIAPTKGPLPGHAPDDAI
jgi:hypothetical protein